MNISYTQEQLELMHGHSRIHMEIIGDRLAEKYLAMA